MRAGHRGDAPVALELVGQMAPGFCLADAAYDSDAIRKALRARGTIPVIPNNPTRRHIHAFDRNVYRMRNVIERTFSRIKDFRRIATRYDKLAINFLSAVQIVSTVCNWL